MYQSEDDHDVYILFRVLLFISFYLSRCKTGRVVIQLESHRRVRVRDDLKPKNNCLCYFIMKE